MRIGRHLQARDLLLFDVDDDPVDHEDLFIAGQRVLAHGERRMADDGVDVIHLADAARVMLKRRDPLRIGRPHDHRHIASRPAGVVGCVAEVLDTVGGQLRLGAGCDVAHPEIEIASERRACAVGRQYLCRRDEPGTGLASGTAGSCRRCA
jgi:hypothetical protein